MPIDVTKIKPKVDKGHVVDSIVDALFKDTEQVADSTANNGNIVQPQGVQGNKGSITGKMVMPYFNRDVVVNVTDEIDADGNTIVTDEDNNFYQTRAKDLKPMPGVVGDAPEAPEEREPGFWNSYWGDMFERMGAGLYTLNGDLFNLTDKADLLLGKAIPAYGEWSKEKKRKWEADHPGQEYKTWLRAQADFGYDYAGTLEKRSDRYEGKNFVDLWKEGSYANMVGEVFLTASESFPQSVVAMAGGGAGLAMIGSTSAVRKYDELDKNPDLKDMPEWSKIINAVASGTFEALYEKMGSASIGRELKSLVLKKGTREAERIVRSGVENWMDGNFKQFGVLFAPVSEGIEEVATTISQNLTDACTGVRDDWNLTDGAFESFVYGAGGGAQFSMVGAPLAIRNKVMQKRSRSAYEGAREHLGSQFPGEDAEGFANGLTFMSPAEQEAALGAMAQSGGYTQEQMDAAVDYANKANKYKEWHSTKAREADEEAKKDMVVQIYMKAFDQAIAPYANESGVIQEVVIAGTSEAVHIVRGDVAVKEAGESGAVTIDTEKSSQELYYKDKDGKMQVVTPVQVDQVVSITDLASLRANYENELRNPANVADGAVAEQPGMTEPEAGIDNGERVLYRDEQGNEVEGIVADAFSNAENVFMQGGEVVPRSSVISKVEQESQAETATPESTSEVSPTPTAVLTDALRSFEIEKGVNAVEQADGSFALDRVFSKSELEKGKAFVERLNEDYADEGVKWELRELPKADAGNPLEKKRYGVVGRFEKSTPDVVKETIPEAVNESIPEAEVAEQTKNEINADPEGISFGEAQDYYEKMNSSAPNTVLYFRIGDGYYVLNEAADKFGELKGIEPTLSDEGYRFLKVNFVDDVPRFVRELRMKPEIVDRASYNKWVRKRVRSNKKKTGVPASDKAVGDVPAENEAKDVTEEKGFGSDNRVITRDRYEELKRQWKEKTGGQLNAGIDPELFTIGTQMAMFHLEAGARKFADFVRSMTADIGESIKPYLKAIYEGAKYMPGMENVAKDMDNPDFVRNFNMDEAGKNAEVKKGVSFADALEKKIKKQFGDHVNIVVGTIPEAGGKVKEEVREEAKDREAVDWILSQVKYPVKSYSTDGIYIDYPSDEVGKQVRKDVTPFVRGLTDILGWRVDKEGTKENRIVHVNIAPAGGDVVFTLWKPGADVGIYVRIPYECDYSREKGYDNYRPGEMFLWRVTTVSDKERGLRNQYHPTETTTGEVAEVFRKEVAEYLKKEDSNGRNDKDRGVPSPGSKDKNAVDAGMDAPGGLPDVQGGNVERVPDGSSEPGIGYKGDDAENGEKHFRGERGDERDGVVPDASGTGEQPGEPDGRADRGNRRVPELSDPVKWNSRNYVIPDAGNIVPKSAISKIRANIAAIRLLKKLESEDRAATREEQGKLSQYSGWGGLAEVLNKEKINIASWRENYGAYHDEIVGLLTGDEFLSAVNSTINAHYTAGNVVSSLWGLAEHLGFKGGKVLEPAAGSGVFFGLMPSHLSDKSILCAYELDSVTGRILSKLFPDASVKVTGYENSKDRNVDLIITNVPFGQIAPYDPVNKELSKLSLHNYFIAKGLKQLKPGGVGIFITSATSMDSGASSKFREWVGQEGNSDFIGAVRLPNNAFSNSAGTEVTTDVLVFRKRDASGISQYAQPFRFAVPVKEAKKMDGTLTTIDVNEYFATHPDMMLGDLKLAYEVNKGGLYSGDDVTLHPRNGEDLTGALRGAIQKFPVDISTVESSAERTVQRDVKQAESGDKEGSLIFRDGEIREVMDGELAVPDWINEFMTDNRKRKVAKREVARQYIEIRETVNRLVDAEVNDSEGIEEMRGKLNKQYDAFAERYGRLNNNLKLRFLKGSDVDWCNVFGVEKVDTKYVEDGTGKLKREIYICKSDIFSKRISFPVSEPTTAASVDDALNISLAYRGHPDVEYISSLLNITEDEARERIFGEGLGFENPVTGLVETKDSYLSGFVRIKLAEAKEAAETDERFKANVKALEGVIPADIPPSQIRFSLGSVFVPGSFVEKFLSEKLGVQARVRYIAEANRWLIDNVSGEKNAKNRTVYGTERVTGLFLVKHALNMSQPVIYDTWTQGGKKYQKKNLNDTAAAQAKMADVVNEFVDYISSNEALMGELARKYNDSYNGFVEKKYYAPGFTHYPGANPDITLRVHQSIAVQRCLQDCTLLAHQVGSGKTFTIITAAMEMRRLKTAKKPMIVVQNQTLEQFVSSFKLLYPAAKILAPGKSQMDGKNRVRLLNMISYGDYDAIVVPQSFITKIPDSAERKDAFIKEQIEALESVLADVDPNSEKALHSQLAAQLKGFRKSLDRGENEEDDEGDSKGKAKLVKEKAKSQMRIMKKFESQADRATDNVRTFEQLGIDALAVDEAHAYKKLGLITKLANVRGIDKGGSKRAFSMYLKVRHVQERTGNKNVIFATGTPITNTMAEAWTMMRFISPDILEKYNVERFDEFASSFGLIEPSLEFTAAGSFKVVERFKSYVNAPEWFLAFRAKTDVVLTEDIPEFKDGKTIPKLKNGQFTQVIISQSDGLQEVMSSLRRILKEWESLPGREKQKKRFVPLVVFNRAKQAAIDLRLLNVDFEDDPGSKTNRVVSEVFRIYEATGSYKGTQLVFSDMYQSPEIEGSGVPRFNLYKDIKDKLVMKGIPEREIAIINDYTDARRELLFEQVKSGEIRVLIGSTEKMGIGVNVQDRLAAVHHVDAPPRPMDFEQRNGRILRQGNMHAQMDIPVEVMTYGVEKTLDATAYQRLAIKQAFINQMMKGENIGREVEDHAGEDDASDLNFNQMMATLSGSQYAMLHQQRSYELKKLEMSEKNYARRQIEINKELQDAVTLVDYYIARVASAKEQIAVTNQYFPDGKIRSVKIGDTVFKENLSETLDGYFDDLRIMSIKKASTLVYNFYVNEHPNPVQISLFFLIDPSLIRYEFLMTNSKESDISSKVQFGQGFIGSFTRLIDNASEVALDVQRRQKENADKIPILKSELTKPFDKTEKIEKLRTEVAELEEQMKKEVLHEPERKENAEERSKYSDLLDVDLDEDMDDTDEDIPERKESVLRAAPPTVSPVPSPVASPTPATGNGELAQAAVLMKHTKTGADLFVVKLGYRVDSGVFQSLKRTAKKHDGDWSKFTNGFNFFTAEDAEGFKAAVNGEGKLPDEDVLFREVGYSQPDAVRDEDIFYSNAEYAVKGIRQEKASPLQWLRMIDKGGGLKGGEDEWMGLSEWLSGSKEVSLTKREVLDFIRSHKIPVFETDVQALPNEGYWKRYIQTPDSKHYSFLKDDVAGDMASDMATGQASIIELAKRIRNGEVYREEYEQAIRDALQDVIIYNYGEHFIVFDPNIDKYVIDRQCFDSFEEASQSLVYGVIHYLHQEHATRGLELYRELALVVPTVEAWNADDPVHFGDVAGGKAVVWVRFGDSADQQGKKVLVIDEIQSQRHQDGKKSGYVKDFKKLKASPEYHYAAEISEVIEKYKSDRIGAVEREQLIRELHQEAEQKGLNVNEMERLYENYFLLGANNREFVPDAPFEKNWHEVAFKRILRYAAENGYGSIAWTKGEQQLKRYEYSRSQVERVKWKKDKDNLYSLTFSFAGNIMNGDDSYEDNVADKIKPKELSKYLPAGVLDKVLKSDKNRGSFKSDFYYGFSGLQTFYDHIIPGFANKYCKKWGAEVGEVVLPKVEKAGQVMWGVEVTPEMRESVMQGQPMFKEDIPGAGGERVRIEQEVMRLERVLGVRVSRVRNRDELPQRIQRMMSGEKRYPGVFSAKDGRVYVVLNEVADAAEAQRTVLHEVVGHMGIRGLFGNRLGRFCEVVLRSLPEAERAELLKRYGGERMKAAQEYVAGFAERYSNPAVWTKVKGWVRDYLRRAGVHLKLTDKDLMYLLWKGVRRLRGGETALDAADRSAKDYALFREAAESYDVRMESVNEIELTDADKFKLHHEVASRRFMFRESYQDRMLAVKNFQELIEEKIGRKLPDYMNSYMFENTLASRSTYETEFFRTNYLRPLTDVIARLERQGVSRRKIENYVMVKHGIERNEYIREKKLEEMFAPLLNDLEGMKGLIPDADYNSALEELEGNRAMKEAELADADFSGMNAIVPELPDGDVEAFIADVENMHSDDVRHLWDKIKLATDFSLRKWYESGMMSKGRYEKVKGMFKNYVPLRGFDETVAADVYEYFTDPNGTFNSPLRRMNGRNSRADNVFANIASMAESSIMGGNKNLLKLHLYHLAEKYPSNYLSINKYWYALSGVDEEGDPVFEPVIAEFSPDMEEYRKNIAAFEARMADLRDKGEAYESRNRLNVDLRLLNNEPEEHCVRVRVAGEEYAILVHGDPRVAQAINGLNDEERTENRVVGAIRAMNRQMAANFTTRNPAFVVSNLTRDFIFSVSALSVKEGSRYRNRFVLNIPKASGAVRRYIQGKADLSRAEDVYFQEFLKNGGETGYTALYNVERFKKLIDREIRNTHRSKAVTAGMKILDFFEAGNRWAEDLSRFSTYLTSRESGRTVLRCVSDAKEVTVNFNRKGSGANGAQVFRSLYLFFNAAVQSLANFGGMALHHPRRTAALLTSYASMGALVPLLLLALGGDDALKEYLNLPDYVRKNNLCLYLGAKHGFVTLPLPIELRAFFSLGDTAFRYLSGDVAGDTASGEVIMGMLDLLPLNPVGGDTPFMPDALKPITQSFFTNRDFTGRPIARITPYNRYVPEYKRVYRGTGAFFRGSSEVLNYMTGGDYATRGGWDKAGQVLSDLFSAEVNVTNPAAVEHLFEAYMGGTFTTVNQLLKTVYDTGKSLATGKNTVEARNIPVANRFYNAGSLYSSQAKMNEKYYDALDELRETESRVRRYTEGMGSGAMDIEKATGKYERMMNDGTIERAEIIKFYSKEIGKINNAIQMNGLPDDEVDELETELYLLKEMMLKDLESAGKKPR